MKEKHLEFLKSITQEFGAAGQEFKVQRKFVDYVKPFSDEITITNHHSVIAHKKGEFSTKILLAGHSDEISMIVKYVDDKGFIFVSPMGGFDTVLLPGQRVVIFHEEKIVHGIFGRKPKHLIKDTSAEIKFDDLWIDIGSTSKEETLKQISLGDIVIWKSDFLQISDDLVVSKAFDDRTGVYVVARVLEELSDNSQHAQIYSVSTTQEEVGARGAKTASAYIDADIVVAIDVTFASDHPQMSEKENGDIKLGNGPVITLGSRVHPNLVKLIKEIAGDLSIPLQYEVWPRQTGTDLDVMHENNRGSAGLLVSIPCRYMHSPSEIVSLKDLDNTVILLAEFCKRLKDIDILKMI